MDVSTEYMFPQEREDNKSFFFGEGRKQLSQNIQIRENKWFS